jgi:hypothetical protein
MMGIIDWRVAQCEAKGVSIRYNSWATVDMVTAEAPDAVIIATGGLPSLETLGEGRDLVVSAWDIISGAVKPGGNVLI